MTDRLCAAGTPSPTPAIEGRRQPIVSTLLLALATLVVGAGLAMATPGTAGAQTDEAAGNTLYVDAVNGNDGNDGQVPSRAFRSLQRAVSGLAPGAILYVMNGTYGGAYINANGRGDAWVRITAYPGHSPVVRTTSGGALTVAGDFVELAGLTVRGEGYGPSNPSGYGIVIDSSHHVRILNNWVTGFPNGGIATAYSSHVTIAGNSVWENARWGREQGSGISVWRSQNMGYGNDANGYSNYVVDNTVWRNENITTADMYGYPGRVTDGNGIILDSNAGYTGRSLVANNVTFANGGRGINVFRTEHVDVVGNTSFQNTQSSNIVGGKSEIKVGESSDVSVRSNVAWPLPGGSGLWVYQSSGVSAQRNLYVADRGGDVPGPEDVVTQSNPGMVNPTTDPATADFRITFGAYTDRGSQLSAVGRYSGAPAAPTPVPAPAPAPAPAPRPPITVTPSQPSGPVVMDVVTGYSPEEWASLTWAAQRIGLTVEDFQRQAAWVTAFLIGISPDRDRPAPIPEQPMVIGTHGASTSYGEADLAALSVISRKHGTDLESRSQKLGAGVLVFIVGLI